MGIKKRFGYDKCSVIEKNTNVIEADQKND